MTLESTSPEGIAIYRVWLSQDTLRLFPNDLREKLLGFLCNEDFVNLVEAAAIIGNCHDKNCEERRLIRIGCKQEDVRLALEDDSWRDPGELRKTVGKLLRQRGVRLPRGKRTNPRLKRLVGVLTPVLLYAGMRLASGSSSRLVRALTMIADEIGVLGDPRDELRRLMRERRQQLDLARQIVLEGFLNGLGPDFPVNQVVNKD